MVGGTCAAAARFTAACIRRGRETLGATAAERGHRLTPAGRVGPVTEDVRRPELGTDLGTRLCETTPNQRNTAQPAGPTTPG